MMTIYTVHHDILADTGKIWSVFSELGQFPEYLGIGPRSCARNYFIDGPHDPTIVAALGNVERVKRVNVLDCSAAATPPLQ